MTKSARIAVALLTCLSILPAISLAQQTAPGSLTTGNAKYAKGDFEGAIADYTQAIEASPKDPVPYFNRGNAKRKKGDLDGAIADYTQTIAIDPKYADAYVNRGIAKRA